MRIFKYLKQRICFLLLYLLLFLLLTASFFLYQLPVQAVAYPMGLGLIFVAVVFALDYRSEQKRQKQVRNLEKEISRLQQELSDNQAKTQQRLDYYTIWAHQIKTPIAAMRLNLQGQDSATDRQLSADLSRIESYADMVLTYLRLESDSTDYVFKEQNLDTIVRGAVRKFSGEFIARKIRLNYEPLQQTVLTDEKWLSFVLEQILSNALKYTPAGSISIYMEETPASANSTHTDSRYYTDSPCYTGSSCHAGSSRCTNSPCYTDSSRCMNSPRQAGMSMNSDTEQILCIRDTGIGIAPEDLPRIFDQGFTGYNGRTDKRASGIGLYLCKRICDGLGYPIQVDSVTGEGTVVRLNLTKM